MAKKITFSTQEEKDEAVKVADAVTAAAQVSADEVEAAEVVTE